MFFWNIDLRSNSSFSKKLHIFTEKNASDIISEWWKYQHTISLHMSNSIFGGIFKHLSIQITIHQRRFTNIVLKRE